MSIQYLLTMINEGIRLHENVIRSISAVYKLQRILGSSRVRIINGCVFPNTIQETLYSVCWLIAATVSIVYYQVFYFSYYYHKSVILYLACAVGTLAQYISCIVNIIYDKLLSRSADVEIYYLLKKVNQELKLDECTYIADFQNFINIVFLSLVSGPYLLGYGLHAFYGVNNPYYTLFLGFELLIIYVDIVAVGCIIIYLSVHLGFLNNLLIRYIANTMPCYSESGISRYRFLNNVLKRSAIMCKKKYINPTYAQYFVSLRYILKCYKTATELYSFTVLTVAATVSIWSYIVIGTTVIAIRTQLYSMMSAATVGSWAIFYFIQLTVLAYVNDFFMNEVKNTKLLCIRILSYAVDDTVTKMVSEMLREIKYSEPAFSVYGIFTLDTRIPGHLLSIITANIMIVIQFSY